MKKLNSVIYNKLLLQAEEAKSQGLTKLASDVLSAIGSFSEEDASEYSYVELQDQVHKDLWKVATQFLTYYGLESTDVEKVDEAITVIAAKLTSELERTLGVEDVVKAPFEGKVPGQK